MSEQRGQMHFNLLLIHGAWCSRKSFSYLLEYLNTRENFHTIKKTAFVEYNCQEMKMDAIIHLAKDQLEYISSNGYSTMIVGHSMGGIVAMKLSQHHLVRNTVTLASPLAGIRFGYLMNAYLQFYAPILGEMTPEAPIIKSIHAQSYDQNPVTMLVANEGFSPFILEANDGVITKASQTSWQPRNANVIEIDANHNEILQSRHTANIIQNLIYSKTYTERKGPLS